MIADRFLYTAEVLGPQRPPPADRVHGARSSRRPRAASSPTWWCCATSIPRWRAPAERRRSWRPPIASTGAQGTGRRRLAAPLAARLPGLWRPPARSAGRSSTTTGRLEETVAPVTELVDGARAWASRRALERFPPTRGPAAPGGPRACRSTPADALEVFLERVDAYAEREPRVAAHLLGGLAGPAVDERRRRAGRARPRGRAGGPGRAGRRRELGAAPRVAAGAYAAGAARRCWACPPGISAPKRCAWRSRTWRPPRSRCRSRASTAPEATAMRARLFQRAPDAVMASLARLASAEAWSLRARWLARRHEHAGRRYPSRAGGGAVGHGAARRSRLVGARKGAAAAPVAALASLEGAGDAGRLAAGARPTWRARPRW